MRSIKWWGDHAHYHAMGQNGVLASMNGIRTSSIAHVMPKSLLKHHQGGQWAQNVAPNRQEQPFGEGGAPLTKMAIMDANAWWLMWHQISTKCAILTSETKKKTSIWCINLFFAMSGHKISHSAATNKWHRTESTKLRGKFSSLAGGPLPGHC